MPQKERIAIDITHWRDKKSAAIIEDTASFALEAGKRNLEKRVNSAVVGLSEFGLLIKPESPNPEDQASLRIYQWALKDTPTIKIWPPSLPLKKEEILDALIPFADHNPGTAMLWLSPPLEGVYGESRIVVYQTIEVNGEKFLFFRALCGNQDEEECQRIVKKVSPFLVNQGRPLKLPASADELRATPLALKIPVQERYSSFWEKAIGESNIWEAIAQGEDLKEKQRILNQAESIIRFNYQEIISADTLEAQIAIGVRIEQQLKNKLGFSLQSGPCGRLYSDLSAAALIQKFSGLNLPGFLTGANEGFKFIHNCGACGRSLNRHMCKGDHCPYCGGVYEGC